MNIFVKGNGVIREKVQSNLHFASTFVEAGLIKWNINQMKPQTQLPAELFLHLWLAPCRLVLGFWAVWRVCQWQTHCTCMPHAPTIPKCATRQIVKANKLWKKQLRNERAKKKIQKYADENVNVKKMRKKIKTSSSFFFLLSLLHHTNSCKMWHWRSLVHSECAMCYMRQWRHRSATNANGRRQPEILKVRERCQSTFAYVCV